MIQLRSEDYGKFLMLNIPWKKEKIGIGLGDINSTNP
jgi:hypothetical protein